MIDGIPGVSWFYKNIFRRSFGYFFVGVSAVTCVIRNRFLEATKKRE